MNKFNYPRNYFFVMRSLREKLPDRVFGALDLQDKHQRVFISCAVCLLAKSGKRTVRNGVVKYGLRLKASAGVDENGMGDLFVIAQFTDGVARSANLCVLEHNPVTRGVRSVFSCLYFCRATQHMVISDGFWQNRVAAAVDRQLQQHDERRCFRNLLRMQR